MKVRIVVTNEGDIALFIDEGTYEQAAKFARQLMEAMAADLGIKIVMSEPEQHRHDSERIHAHTHVHAHGG
jgi:hypothetical protein